MANSENRIKQLKSMLNDGLISKEEFDDLRRKMRNKEDIQPSTSNYHTQHTSNTQSQNIGDARPQNNRRYKQRPAHNRYIFRYIISLVVVLIFFSIYIPSSPFSFLNSNDEFDVIKVSEFKNAITLEQFEQIETGMTYEQVKSIIGIDGTVQSEVGEPDSEYHTISYRWDGNGFDNSMANVTFLGGKVYLKVQVGLE